MTLEPIPGTPAYISGRKRKALEVYTGFRSSSYKTRKTFTSSSLRKVVKVIEYEYDIVEP